MPPKAKFCREEIAQAGLEIVRSEGEENMTARALGKRLGSSACPIFTVFESMEDVQAEVLKAAKAVYSEYINKGLQEEPSFKGVGRQYILFAIEEPNLFRMLFMHAQKQHPSISTVLPMIEDNYESILRSVMESYNLTEDKAKRLYKHLWIYSHGIAVLCATNMCVFSTDEITEMISEAFKGTLAEISGGEQ